MQALFLIGNELKSPVLASKMKTLVDKGFEEARTISRENGKDNISIEKFLNLRYQGQSYEICIPYKKDFSELFHLAHEHNFGYRLEEKPLELVSIQCSIRVNRTQRELPRKTLTRIKNILPLGEHPVYFENGPEKVSVFDRSDMTTGFTLAGPALVVDNYTTILLPVSFVLEVDELQNIIIQTS
jgi:N-methylhydantoinase A